MNASLCNAVILLVINVCGRIRSLTGEMMEGEGSVYFIKENADLANVVVNSYNTLRIHFSCADVKRYASRRCINTRRVTG